jgi:hypothetical protein
MSVEFASEGPCFVTAYRPEKGGVDFLGLRQVNLDMMAVCLPGINNVTRYIRPFSVLSWIYWKFYKLSQEKGENVTPKELRDWKEKVETLFTWGHKLYGSGGVPGIDAKPPANGSVPLSFAAWKRNAQNTSLMAAVQYGPAAKTIDGLGFLEPLGRGFFQVRGYGVALAQELDTALRRFELLKALEQASATAKQAERIFPAWSIFEVSRAERQAFRKAFFDPSAIGDSTPMGRRSTTIELARIVLGEAQTPLTDDNIRIAMFRARGRSSRVKMREDPKLRPIWLRWVVLQIRQSQRLAFEGLLSWFECLLVKGYRDTEEIVERTLEAIESYKGIFSTLKPGKSLDLINRKTRTIDEALNNPRDLDLFWLSDELVVANSDYSDKLAPLCLRTLFLTAAFTRLLADQGAARLETKRGGADRISLEFWTKTLLRCRDFELRDFLRYLFERLILSQHFAVAARRFDGNTQRLRISIEEDGLEFLPDKPPLVPSITPDRLRSALSLMEDCGLIGWDDSKEGYFAK